MTVMCGVASSCGRVTSSVSIALGRAASVTPIPAQRRVAQAPAATTTAPASMRPAAVSTPVTALSRRTRPVTGVPGGVRLPAKAPPEVGGAGVATLGLVGGGADVVDVDERLQRLDLARRQRDGVDTEAAEHGDVLAQRRSIRWAHDGQEARAGEDR